MSADENAKASSLLTEEEDQTDKECIDHLIDDLLLAGYKYQYGKCKVLMDPCRHTSTLVVMSLRTKTQFRI